MHESIREMLRRIRREALKRRWIAEPEPPKCEKCGNSIAYVPTVWAVKGEEDCPQCRADRIAYHARYGGVAVVRITAAPTREQLAEELRGA
jgi:predicted Zn-ribbon and HTH transcriptional regulator